MVKNISLFLRGVGAVGFVLTFGTAFVYLFATVVQLRSLAAEEFIFAYGIQISFASVVVTRMAYGLEEGIRTRKAYLHFQDGCGAFFAGLALFLLVAAVATVARVWTIDGAIISFFVLAGSVVLMASGIAFLIKNRQLQQTLQTSS